LVTALEPTFVPEREIDSHAFGWAERVLRRQAMPPDEVVVVMTSTDRVLVLRHLELHLERLEERLIAQRRSLAQVQRILAGCADSPTAAAGHRAGRTTR
jgi:hypothetical protein